jgi:hypothetical protein
MPMSAANSAPASEMLFAHDDVIITKTVAKFGSTSFAVANIGSVMVQSARKARPLGYIVLVASLPVFYLSQPVAMLGVVLGIALLLLLKSRTDTIVLKTSSGDIRALSSNDPVLVQRIREALEHAFALRG